MPESIAAAFAATAPPRTMTPAEEYAALVALRAGLDDRIEAAKERALASVATQASAKWRTPYGPVNMYRPEEKVEIIPAAFLAFAQEHYPDEVVTTYSVRTSFERAFLAELAIVAGEVVHKPTGELVDFARIRPEGEPRLSYPASNEQRDAKDLARMLFEENADTLTARLQELTA
jgi:hypothetical protein